MDTTEKLHYPTGLMLGDVLSGWNLQIDGLIQKRRNCIAYALELRLFALNH